MTQNSALQVFRGGWKEVGNAVFTTNDEDISPADGSQGIFIKSDGTQLFSMTEFPTFIIETYPLSIPYDVNTKGVLSDTFPVTDDGFPVGIFFKDDGTKLFVVGNDTVTLYGYTLPIPWKPSSIVDPPVTLSLSATVGTVVQCTFSRDGDFVFIVDQINVYSYALPIPWDITSGNPISPPIFTPTGTASSIAFKREGDKMYIGDSPGSNIKEYTLSTINDITSASLISTLPTGIQQVTVLQFRSNGQEFFTLGSNTGLIMRFHTDQDWETGDASHFTNSYELNTAFLHRDVQWKPDGSEFLSLGTGGADEIQSYSTVKPWNQTDATPGGVFDLQSIGESNPDSFWFLKGGKTGYVVGNVELVRQISATTGWDPTTMSDAGKSFSINAQINSVSGIWFSDHTDENNKRMWYAFGRLGSVWTIAQYEMTGEDISTSGHIRSKTLPNTGSFTGGIFLQQNGRMLYFVDRSEMVIEIMSMSTPGDISTLTPFDLLDVSTEVPAPFGLFIREDNGKKLYLPDITSDLLISYDISEEFNNSLITDLGDELVTDLGESLVYV